MELEQDQLKVRRALVRAQYGDLFERVAAILFEDDPIDINYESNTDEYEPEAETILPRLNLAMSVQDVEAVVHQEFCRWFGAEEAGEPQRYHAVAARIFAALHKAERKAFHENGFVPKTTP
ncbi:MAG: hypothetical protein LBQ81_12420 [Zoogloeaceae bacterium]|jgi:hypothetical protein|nr:hypothetical protein [Zoogloeaceae bacterium]